MEKVRYMISDAASMTGVESHVLRYWEDELDLSIPRNEMGHRYYTRENILEFQRIRELKEQGYQLKAIRTILHNGEPVSVSNAQTAASVNPQQNYIPTLNMKSSIPQTPAVNTAARMERSSIPASQTVNTAAGTERNSTPVSQTANTSAPMEHNPIPTTQTACTAAPMERNSIPTQQTAGTAARVERNSIPAPQTVGTAARVECNAIPAPQTTGTSAYTENTSMPTVQTAAAPVNTGQPPLSAEERMAQFRELMSDIVGQAVSQNNEELSLNISQDVRENVLKEMNYLFREQEEAQEARYKKLDAAIRGNLRKKRPLFVKADKPEKKETVKTEKPSRAAKAARQKAKASLT